MFRPKHDSDVHLPRTSLRGHLLLATTLVLVALLGAQASAQLPARLSVDSAGGEGLLRSGYPDIADTGRYVVFDSFADNLVIGDNNGTRDVFLRDRSTSTTTMLSWNSSGTSSNGYSVRPRITPSHRFVSFVSGASDLVPGDNNRVADVFVRLLQLGTTELVSVATSGAQANADCDWADLSWDARYVVFQSEADNLVPNDTNGQMDVFVRDRVAGTTIRVSVASDGTQANQDCDYPTISEDGSTVAFSSRASNLVPGDNNGTADIFVHDLASGVTERVTVDSAGNEANGLSFLGILSADGQQVVFLSTASNLIANDTNGFGDIFVRNRTTSVTERISVSTGGAEGNATCFPFVDMSPDGRFIAFTSDATNMVFGDNNIHADIFLRDRLLQKTTRCSLTIGGGDPNNDCSNPSVSRDGRLVAYTSSASNLVGADNNGETDAFIFGKDLIMQFEPPILYPLDFFEINVLGGEPGGPLMLVLETINGGPWNKPVLFAQFQNNGSWGIRGQTPGGLTGLSLGFLAVGFDPFGELESSNPVEVLFR